MGAGIFFINGYTQVIVDSDKPTIFLKNTGDKVSLWFRLNQEISRLNDNESLFITDGGVDDKRDKGLGTLCINYIDYQNFKHPTFYNDYLKALSVGADTNVTFFEEGDYEVILNYRIKDDSSLLWSWRNYDYCIKFNFSVRNGNCMIFLRDAKTQEELTTYAPNGFYLDLTKSRYLDINVKKEVLEDNSNKLDVRFNKPAKDGDRYTNEGVYTITLKNRYTKEVTTKVISVGNDPILNAYAATLLPIGEIKKQIQNSANKNPPRIEHKSSLSSNIKTKEETNRNWFIQKLVELKKWIIEKLTNLFGVAKNNDHKSKDVTESLGASQKSKSVQTENDNHKPKNVDENLDSFQKSESLQEKFAESLTENLKKKGYKVEEVKVKYLSQEYIEELQYNSLSNVYFGKSLRELEQQFQGAKYVFTLDKDNKTVVQKLTNQDVDILKPIIRDVAIGSGVILVTVTVSVVSGGTVSVVFAAAAKTGLNWALYGGLIDSVIAGVKTGIQTKDFDQTIKAMAVAGAEGFKWGAIAGVVAGGASKAWELKKAEQSLRSTRGKEIGNIGRSFEKLALKRLGGEQNHIYFEGKRIKTAIKGCSKPDIVRRLSDSRLEVIECKNYDLKNNLPTLISTLKDQISRNIRNMPGFLERLAIKNRNYSKEFLDKVRKEIQEGLKDVYKDIPISFI